jgi:membrane protease YdiL (CAAX protease family)
LLKSFWHSLRIALLPLLILFALITVSCVLSYGILMIAGDILPLRKMIAKLTQLLLVVSIFPLRHWLKLSWSELGFAQKTIFFKQMAIGVALGLLTLLPMLALLYGLGVNVWDDSKVWTIGIMLKKTGIALLLALLISFLEEPIFRGVLLSGLQQKMTLWAAILLSSAYYGVLHFLETKTQIPYTEIRLMTGFNLVAEAIGNCLNPAVLAAFVGLWMVGIFLSVVRTQIPQSLGLCIGIHASWVWQIKISKEVFNTNQESPYLYLVSDYDGLVGPLIAVWLLFATVAYWTYQRRWQ